MKGVNIDRQRLLSIITENRKTHIKEFEEAHVAWKRAVVEGLKNAYDNAQLDKDYVTYLELPEPASHESDYDTAIRMLELEQEPVVWLDEHEFEQLVQDKWSWKARFSSTNVMYTQRK